MFCVKPGLISQILIKHDIIYKRPSDHEKNKLQFEDKQLDTYL